MTSQAIQAFRADAKYDGAQAYTYRMAGYLKDARYIHEMAVREFGVKRAPSVETIRAMQEDHRRKKERFAELASGAIASASYYPDNDNGEPWRPRGLIKPKRIRHSAPKGEQQATPEKQPITLPDSLPTPVSKRIVYAVAHVHDMTVEELISNRRSRRFIYARAVAIRLLRDLTWENGLPRFSYPQIGRIMGGRDHTTILYAIEHFDEYCATDPEMRDVYETLRDEVCAA